MRRFNTTWTTVIAAMFMSSTVMLTGCDSQSASDEQTIPETENSTGEPADVEIDTPGLNLEINKKNDSAEIDLDVPDGQKSNDVDIDVNSPE